MKRFYFTENTKKATYGTKVSGNIYQLTKGKLVYRCEYSYNTASCSGDTHEIFQALMTNNFIPKKWNTSSESETMGRGYFCGEVVNHYSIDKI